VAVGAPRGAAPKINPGEVKSDPALHPLFRRGTTTLKDPPGQTRPAPPMVVKSAAGTNIQMCGRAGIHAGNHSFDAVNADTGKFMWRFYSVPGPGQPGFSSWQNDAWEGTSIGRGGYQAVEPENKVGLNGTRGACAEHDPQFPPR